ncbi:MAG: Nif3-like dinuclear metal center hexameric protein [Saprospiraceae bacterium]|nr:Nif3-like dinuclear metal center hexameric protein [Saprospiraceae bacterium]
MANTIQEIYDFLHVIAPFQYQEGYDNAGLIVGDPQSRCTGVITCLDSTEEVIDEAIEKGANLVVAHHPIVFRGLKRFNGANYVEKAIIKAIKNDVAILAIHTNLDNVITNGVNERIANRIGLEAITPIVIKNEIDQSKGAVGSGVIGELPTSINETDFLHALKEKMNVSVLKHTQLLEQKVSKVAVCGGVGGFLLKDAIRAGAQVFVTSDYKYHEFFDANGKIVIVDIGHYESEQFTINLLQELISRKFSTFAAHCTEINTNPVNYL